jgi:hypothetical protein
VKIDLNRVENEKPNATPDDGEMVESFSLPLKGLRARLLALEGQGFGIHGIVRTFAQGTYRDGQGVGVVEDVYVQLNRTVLCDVSQL